MSSTPETINAGTWREWFEPGDFFRLLATTAPVSVEFYSNGKKTVELQSIEAGYAEYFRGEDGKLPFDRVRIYSATTQTVQFVTRQGSDVRYDRGASSVTGTVSLDAATLMALEQINVRPEAATGFYATTGALAANTADVVFLAGANVNGAIVFTADAVDVATATLMMAFVAKNAAPTTPLDGEVIAQSHIAYSANMNPTMYNLELKNAQYVPAGKGLYFISSVAMTNPALGRSCRYKLL
jgi:hypothetical protein